MNKIKRTFGFILSHPLGKRHPLKSLFRFIVWQLQSSLSPSKLIIKPFVGQVKFYAKKGLTGITGNIYTGLHEFGDMGFLIHFLRPEDIFFDVGANVGSYTLLASGACKAKSIAIEPVKTAFNILQQNITLNNLQHSVKLLNSGAGAIIGALAFSSAEDTTNHVLADDEIADNISIIPIITIDSLLTDGTPSLIKIDVEGYETEVLKGMATTLKSPSLKAIIIELNGSGERYGFDEQAIHQLLIENNFEPYSYDPFTRSLTLLAVHGNYNTIYCRDIDFINDRLKNAPGIKLMGEII
ncbi:FkbM family methyltransferase [Mucilaginibacter puniceus]